ncbi:DUF2505 domain-containing protein [Alcanivorax quisquiliarum]|uniref:DUF2505 domain-containing protein n=1 Tax=Alcanivorax quisquiliarum TaxID=2933565 RepID=A0ABT0E2W9_9GAMM|nr:DUF2505 domain-containing protein [Alcanivorax quisquiliarum]MCK0536165.1 DUF2505 domain-containing protein [Alcanivorax quisquiliarum]
MQLQRCRSFAVPATRLFQVLTSKPFFDARHAMSGASQYRYDAFGPTERGLLVRIIRELDLSAKPLPGFARRFVGESAALTMEFLWTHTQAPPYRAELRCSIGRVPVQVHGHMTIADEGGEALQTLALTIDSSVPLVGSKLAAIVAAQLDKGLQSDYRATLAYLQANP